ncbi:hypothetical protein [Leucobacter chromiireducens]|uniref:hypothetical protein n=1 Tax=Leucobacter chromiireducens TaxID=283877 RepID=UPI000F62F4E5|nr:hypothetical protein [Leucobacter chromiireducens]
MHYADDPDYTGDWWNHHDYDWPNDVWDAARAVELAREAGRFATQADYDAAYAGALQLASPDLLQHRLIEQTGLRALASLTIDAARLAGLQQLCPLHAVLNAGTDPYSDAEASDDAPAAAAAPVSGLLVMSLSQDRAAQPRVRWTSHHPVVVALLAGSLDGALTLPMLARGEVCIALTSRSLKTIVESSIDLLDGLERKWRCLSSVTGAGDGASKHTVHAVHGPWSTDLWHSSAMWQEPAAGELFWDAVDDPRRRGVTTKAAHALHQERLLVGRALAELELLLGMSADPDPADPRTDPGDYELG